MRSVRRITTGVITCIGILLTFSAFQPGDAAELVGLDHFAVNVHDLQTSADWYNKILGFQVLHKWTTTWMVGRDNIKVGLFLRPNAKPPGDTDSFLMIQHVAFLVDGDKFANALDEITKKSVKIVQGPEDTGIAYSFFFNDPDGNLLEITTYHPAAPINTGSAKATLTH